MIYHGAKWWKFDFHTHTPISIDYGKGPNQDTLKRRTPREWLLDYMSKEIDCVAVTDHNSGEWIDTLKAEVNLMREENIDGFREIAIFPGVEITVHGNIHLLAIFDPTDSSRQISNLLSKCEYNGTYGDSDDCTTKSFNEVVNIIHQMKGLAIPAHVDMVRGLFEEEEGNSLKKCLTANGLLAMQVCNLEYVKPQIYNDMKLNFTEIAGSDSHHPEFVGSSYTWVKMEYPNLEALRLALHDGEDGIIRYDLTSVDPNEAYKRFFIESIEVSNGAKAGRGRNPLKVNFSPWLNAIIGGRGSGKSSLIEYMRLPFDKTRGLPPKLSEEFQEFRKVPKERGKPGMLTKETQIRVEMQKDGRRIALTWQGNKIIEEHQNEMGFWESIEESSNIDSRFPLRIFSQKHLYSLTEDPNYILGIIDQQFDKLEWEEEKERLSTNWLQTRAKLRDLSTKINAKGNIQTELDDLKAKMKIYEESGHKELLEEYQKFQIINQKLNQDLQSIDNYYERLKGLFAEVPKSLFSTEEFTGLDQDSLKILKEQANQFQILMDNMNDVLINVEQFKANNRETVEEIPWHQVRLLSENKYHEFVQKLEATGEKNPNAYSEFVARKTELEKKMSEISSLEEQFKLQKEESIKIFKNIDSHEKELRNKRLEIIQQWVGTNTNIKMYLKVMGNLENAEETFRGIIRKSGREYAKDILERDDDNKPQKGLLYELMESSIPWEKRNDIVKKVQSVNESDTKGFGKLFINHIVSLKSSTPEDIDRMIIWYPEDKITLKLVNPNNKEEDIETGSAGQRTAAMLSLMLLLDDSPIIIDQPEEDLDTKRISDLVVTSLRTFKTKQQVIVITHNPNIPVNGAAENIVQMNFAGGQIQKQLNGALQNNNVREAVCEVMEGGKEALDKRYFRISRALEG
ncbi:AAA family ATPase [Fictibacillus enclensis]|uniref:TrlF family AAA-like ATPase n=1 Tax=Fictibacillus enclensis TaxID=1017270 RepID=UPI0025A2D5EB|nr:AAA family ATPase [Fictibacillus enclensis]MDM5197042.1 AAA family ATPase [Fictibacillus enclensis]